ncbi:MAG TPA: hypothetical protein VG146_00615 [Verrucomicrobiae bacterium]|nr:hypothetical protein [Verrucomicrobiae bacterium]
MVLGTGLLAQPHPFLPGTFGVYVWLGLAAEIGALGILAARGTRPFLTVCLGLSVMFIGYHAIGAGLRVPAPCPCLGGLLGHWKPMVQVESAISFVLACGLGTASFGGLFATSRHTLPAPDDEPSLWPALGTACLWLLAGTVIVWLWRGRVLGGDEGMEAAKSLQFLKGHGSRMWNDQPALWSIVGAVLFRVCGPSLSWGRMLVVLVGASMPLVWVAYWSREGLKWSAAISTILLWLAGPSYFASFMLEAPAYSIGLASLLPLILRGDGWLPFCISVLLAATGLSVKLTAAFALVVPFAWLCQRSYWRAVGWGFSTVTITIVGSLIQPGWSWATMVSSHLDFVAKEVWLYHMDPAIYADAWLICLLALFAIANRYATSRLRPLAPWLWAEGVALLIHLVHRPFWDFYNLHLLTPLAVIAGVGAVDLWKSLHSASLTRLQYRSTSGAAITLCLLWAWQQESRIAADLGASTEFAGSAIQGGLKSLERSHSAAFAMNPLWTFAADEAQTPAELTILPRKRFWSGQISESVVVAMLASNHVDALVLAQDLASQPAWTNLLAGYLPTARDGETVLFVRRELNPHPISTSNDQRSVILHQIGF